MQTNQELKETTKAICDLHKVPPVIEIITDGFSAELKDYRIGGET